MFILKSDEDMLHSRYVDKKHQCACNTFFEYKGHSDLLHFPVSHEILRFQECA